MASTILYTYSLLCSYLTADSLLFLQITELSLHNNFSSYWSVFVSQISGPSGLEWILRSITSIIVIVSAVGYYYIIKRNIRKLTIGSVDIESPRNNLERKDREEEHRPLIIKPIKIISVIITLCCSDCRFD